MSQVLQAEQAQFQVETPESEPGLVRVTFAEDVRLLHGDCGSCKSIKNPLGLGSRFDADPILVWVIHRLDDFGPDIKAIGIVDFRVLELRVNNENWRKPLAVHLRMLSELTLPTA
jgi:hypothetical protein